MMSYKQVGIILRIYSLIMGNEMKNIGLTIKYALVSFLFTATVSAQNKVIVIPLESTALAAPSQTTAVLVDGNSNVVGNVGTLVSESVITVISEQGYVFNVDRLIGDVLPYSLGGPSTSAFYSSIDCTGSPIEVYVRGNTYLIAPSTILMYAPNQPVASVMQNYESILTGFIACNPISGTIETFALLANDPLVTGVPTTAIKRPIVIESR
jgi:hypothetical protein